jgi:hypothetical protein
VAWEVEVTDQFQDWFAGLSASDQDAIDFSVRLLIEFGPQLHRPHADSVRSSRHDNMRELRSQNAGRPIRCFYAFDPRRTAILLIGGDKTGDDRFYDTMISRADDLYDDHLAELRREGII